jgi:hypothetical protein
MSTTIITQIILAVLLITIVTISLYVSIKILNYKHQLKVFELENARHEELLSMMRAEHNELYLDFVKIKKIVTELPCAKVDEKSERMENAKEKLHELLATVFKDNHNIHHEVVSINADNPVQLANECKKLPTKVLKDILESMEQRKLYKAASIVKNEITMRT